MYANQMLMDVLAHNLANINTIGFKRDGIAFREQLEKELVIPEGRAYRSVGRLGSGPALYAEFTYSEPGPSITTNNPLDVMLEKPNQFLAVDTPDGVRYTRDGSLRLNTEGILVNRDGHPVLDRTYREIRIGLPGEYTSVEITPQGAVVVDGVEVADLGVFEGSLAKTGKGLWIGDATPVEEISLLPGTLEASNVNAVETMVQMILLLRNFESAQRALQTQDEMTGKLIQSLANL
jgi:flagellar basal-body rod protein FlgF